MSQVLSPPRTTHPATGSGPRLRDAGLLLALATLAAFALRLALAWPTTGPIVVPDEMGYLVQARWLTGDDAPLLTDSPYYAIGYPVLLVPAALIAGDDPERFWRLLLVTNAVVGALLVPLLAVLLRRTLGTGPRLAVVAAFVASCHPGYVLPAGQGWGEVAIPPAFLLWVLAMSELYRRPGWASALGAGVAATATYSAHSRAGLPVLTATVLALAVAARRRAVPGRPVLVALAAAALSLLALVRLQSAALDTLWFEPASVSGNFVQNLLDPAAVVPFGAQLAGTLWNALVSTAGLVVLGLAGLVGVVRGPDPQQPGARATAATALLGALGVWVLAALFFIDASRADQFLHGRYIETVLPLPLAAGVAVLASARHTRRVLALGVLAAGLIVACAAAVRAVRGDLLETAPFYYYSTNGVMLPSLDPARVHLETATTWGLAALAVVVVTRLLRPWLSVATALALLLASTLYVGTQAFWPIDEGRYGGWTAPPALPGVEEVAISDAEALWFEQRAYHFWMPGVRLRQVDLTAPEPPQYRYVIAPADWPGGQRPGVRARWTDNYGLVVLYDQGTGLVDRQDLPREEAP